MFFWILDKVIQLIQLRTKVKVLVHEAYFLDDSLKKPYYFIKVINLSHDKIINITHIYVKDKNKDIDILNPQRVLPKKLEKTDVWETWIDKSVINDKKNIFNNIYIVLSNEKVIRSRKNLNVRPQGFVA